MTILPDQRVLAVSGWSESQVRLLEVTEHGSLRTVLTVAELAKLLRDATDVKFGRERRFVNWSWFIRCVTWVQGVPIVALHSAAGSAPHRDSVVAFLRLSREATELLGYWHVPSNKLLDFTLVPDKSGPGTIVAGLQAAKPGAGESILWARARSGRAPIEFESIGAIRIPSAWDIEHVLMLDDARGVAAETFGDVFAFNIDDGSYSAIPRGGAGTVKALLAGDW